MGTTRTSHYQLIRSGRARRLRLEVDGAGKVIIKAPPQASQDQIDNFYQAHLAWIEQYRSRQQYRIPATSDTHLYLFGTQYNLINTCLSKTINRKEAGFHIVGREVHFTPIVAGQIAPTNAQLERFLKNTGISYLIARTAQLAERMQLCYQGLSFKQQRTRWGSCSNRGNLNFNWRLVHFAPAVIDYVIIHELAHLVEANHSARFWRLVANYDPEYKAHRRALKQLYW